MSYYDVLEVDISASEKEIKKSYKKLVKKYHPDVYKGTHDFAEQKIKEINEAYEVLSNKDLREKYDNELFPSDYDNLENIINNFSKNSTSYNENKTYKYEDLYKYDYYKPYTTNYYGVDKSGEKNTNSDSFKTFTIKITPFRLILITIIIISFFILIIGFLFSSIKQVFKTSTVPSKNNAENYINSYENNINYNNYFSRNTTYSDIVTKFGTPKSEYYYRFLSVCTI